MREIKFRAWAEKTVNNIWEYAYPLAKAEAKESLEEIDEGELLEKYSQQWKEINPNSEKYTKTKEMITDIKVNGNVQRPYGYEVIEIMQYTGLKDKNGKEIYEGDIVSYRMAGIAPEISPLIVEYRENATWGVIDKMGDKLMPSWQFAEVIGNIYENGDLLK